MGMFGVVDDSEISAGTAEPTALDRLRGIQQSQSQQGGGMFGVPPKPGDLPGQVFLQPTSGPSAQEVLGAGFRQSTVVSVLERLLNGQGGVFPPVDGYSSWNDIKDKPQYWEYAPYFAGFHHPEQSRQLMERIDREKKRQGDHGGVWCIWRHHQSARRCPIDAFAGPGSNLGS